MKYTALIVTFNRLGKLKKTVEETLKLEFTNIVIVNNGSTDGTQAWLSSIVDTRVIVLTLTENTGGAGGFKTGSQYICEQLASDWVFFYDDDAYPYPDTLKSFSQLEKRGCRVFSGLVKDPQGKPCPMNMPFSRVPTSLGDTVRYLRYPGEFIPAANRSMFVQTVSFVGMVIHRDLLTTSLDHIHEQLFIYFDAQSFNALVFFRTYHDVQKIIKNIKPDLLHCITIKPCLIGGVLAKKFNLPVIVSFVGLGRVFSSDSMPLKLLRQFTIAAYKYISSNKRCIFMFEHDRDRKKLAKLVGLEEQQTIVIDGAGINPEIYKYSLEQDHDVPVVLFASRMLWSKGLGDLIEAKKILRSKNIHFTLNVAGILVENDKDAISLQVIENWHQQGLINWLGRSNNVCDLIEQSNIVALPSVYSEGVPRILLEASSVGRACIAYDVGGCDSLIIDNDNGIIVKSNSPEELADKLAFLLSNPKARVEMGIKGRKRIQDKFSSVMIIDKTLQIYHDVVR